jgi:hypothetical protein
MTSTRSPPLARTLTSPAITSSAICCLSAPHHNRVPAQDNRRPPQEIDTSPSRTYAASRAGSVLPHSFLHERVDPRLVGGGQLGQSEVGRPHGAFVEVRVVTAGIDRDTILMLSAQQVTFARLGSLLAAAVAAGLDEAHAAWPDPGRLQSPVRSAELPESGPTRLGQLSLLAGRRVPAAEGAGPMIAWLTSTDVPELGPAWSALSSLRGPQTVLTAC